MKFFEPLQRLDQFVYLKAENAVYVKSTVNVFLPAGYSLLGRDPVYDSVVAATLYNNSIIDNSAVDSYIFEQSRLIRFLDKVPDASPTMDPKTMLAIVQKTINEQLAKAGFFTVTCVVYNPKGSVGGQVTNTLSSQGEVVIL
jgi:hypothetical protein